MKKLAASFFVTFSLCFLCMANSVPQFLEGIWEGIDRIVFFENDDAETPHMTVILKPYYGWYYDRALEDDLYAQKEPRVRNTATSRIAAKAQVSFDGRELSIDYSKHENQKIEYRIENQNIFFNFWDIIPVENGVFYKGKVGSDGILMSDKNRKTDFYCYFVTQEGKVYKIRYWKSKMDYDADAKATLRLTGDESQVFTVPKMIFSEGVTYTCAAGRRTVVRNPEESELFDGKEVIYSDDGSFAALKTPFYTQLADKKTFQDLMEIVKNANSRRKPDPPPLFPDEPLDYHWDLIDMLEKGNPIIEAVRERQKDFGVRGKDTGR